MNAIETAMPLPILVFDIETVTDINSGAALHDLDLEPEDALQALNKIRRQTVGHDFQKLPLHEIVCISGLWVDQHGMRLFSFEQNTLSESEILKKFFSVFENRNPTLVSWNGSNFDIPVLMFRALYHGISAASLFDQGELDSQKKYNNYTNRYHSKHTDLIDVLALFNLRNFQKLDEVAQFLGFPGKRGVTGYRVRDYVKQNDWLSLTNYCESDVLNTWLIYLRWSLLRGHMDQSQYSEWTMQTIHYLRQHCPQQHDFLVDWKKSSLRTAFTRTLFDGVELEQRQSNDAEFETENFESNKVDQP